MSYKVFTTGEFDRVFKKIDPEIQRQIEKEITQLEINPFVGKPLGYKFFREKKIQNHLIYYLIYEDFLVVFVITISGKKDQQKAIETIKTLIPYYREEIKKKLKC